MRRFLASSIGVTCAAALSLPLVLPAPPASAASVTPRSGESPSGEPLSAEPVSGSTQSIPLVPFGGDRAGGPDAPEQGVTRRGVRSFSLVGVVWDDPETELRGRVQVRTRATGTARWSGWQDIETHNQEHAADPESAERASGRVRGSTAPLWVGASDGVELRVRAEIEHRTGVPGVQTLPSGLRLELVDPGLGTEPPPVGGGSADTSRLGPLTAEAAAASAVNAELAPLGALEIPALSARDADQQNAADPGAAARVAPRPAMVTRRGWGADEQLRERQFLYTKRVKVAFVHHTASGNNYSCSQAASVIRSIYRYHVLSTGWRDIGYNFLIDKCGTIYEGRAGGVAKAVMGAHTRGFNANSMGVAVIGSFGTTKPPGAAVTGIAKLTAWKLGLYGAVANGKTYLTSGGGNLYAKGKKVRLNVISGHRDGFATECPGRALYSRLGTVRSQAARYQGR
ncbi:peptidoglycan recognition protein family protein [Streptomyces acidicola]|uniref:Peptidoglycan recognition protein n=1 Tax=Streptomyces acidicola TaxID=2596892 RepID=A0A5N8WTR5_9ACTN|nr:peptidoglycan recognition protein [Streptomyces acidicola]MPY49938.1 peptidoglycan recognition protein [Streptomyces acidicola]